MENQNQSSSFEKIVDKLKDPNSFFRIYLLSIIYIISFGLISIIINTEARQFCAFPILAFVGIILLHQRKRSGWILLTLHTLYASLFLVFNISNKHIMRYIELPTPLVALLIPVCGLIFIFLLHKKVRLQFNIHLREISICILGVFFLLTIPGLFQSASVLGQPRGSMFTAYIAYCMVIIFVLLFLRPFPPLTVSNWNQYMEKLEYDAQTYYTRVQEMLETKNVAGISYSRVMLRKRGMFSSQRQYLRIQFEDLVHDISFYPFALGTYASSWSYVILTGGEALIASIPYIGLWLHKKFYPETYYIADSRAMFQLLLHEVQLEIIDSLLLNKGLRKLSEKQREPQLKSIFDR